jgi:FK506-binding nuclear protein
MAALDPTEPAEVNENSPSTATPRATLKIVRQPLGDEDDDEYMREILGDDESDSEDEDEDEEEVNGGPSDPSKSKKARKEAALKQLIESIDTADSDEEMEDGPNGLNGLTANKKGKAKATDDDDEESDEDSEDDDEEVEVEEFVLCTLDPEKASSFPSYLALQLTNDQHYQQPLDITIAENERVFFKVTGSHTIYLTGNYVIPDDDGHNHHHKIYDSDSDSEEDEYDLSPDEDELELEMDDEESDILDALEDPRVTEVDSDEEQPPKLVKAEEKKGKNKRSADELDEGASLDDIMAKSLKSEAAAEPKLTKKQLKKLKKNNGEAAAAKVEETKNGEVKSDKADKKVQFAKNLEQGPTGSAEKAKVAEAPLKENTEKGKPTLGVKTVNGVKIDDKKLGSGPAAKKGDRAGMRYIGKLTNGQVFDCKLPYFPTRPVPELTKLQRIRRGSHSHSSLVLARSSRVGTLESLACKSAVSVDSPSPHTSHTEAKPSPECK